MDSLTEMFPALPEARLMQALSAANGDVARAAESLLPPDMQILRDEALARSLQAAEVPNSSNTGTNTGGTGEESWAEMAQPVINGISYVAESAKNAVQYVAAELIAAASLGDGEEERTNGYGGSSVSGTRPRREDTASVVTGGAVANRGDASGVHMRPTRSGRSSTRAGGLTPKKDD